MDLQLQNKVVVVTGGSRGIGEKIATTFVEEGAKVAIVARGEEDLKKVNEKQPHIFTIQADVTCKQDREKAIDEVVRQFGTVDILINNAGGSNGSTVEETDMDTFEEAFAFNYFSAVHFSKLVYPMMKKNKAGSIINISSIFGRESGGKVTYNNAKAALISFTKSFADEAIQHGVRVNSVAPGSIIHPRGSWQKRVDENPKAMEKFIHDNIPAGRFGTVAEIANVVVFLASDKASWIVGASINVDGGQSFSNF